MVGQEKKSALGRTKKAITEMAIAVAPKQDQTVAMALADLASSVRGNVDAARVDRLLRAANRAAERGATQASLLIRNGPLQEPDRIFGFVCCDEGMTNEERFVPRAFDKGNPTQYLKGREDWKDNGKHAPAPPFLITLHKDYGIHWSLGRASFFWFWRTLTLRWTP